MRAIEIQADLIIKATKVDGIYDSDPLKNRSAKRFSHLTYLQALNLGLRVMDLTALTLCMDNKLPIVVTNLWRDGTIEGVVSGEEIGTLVN